MGDSDASKNCAECSPGCAGLRFRKPHGRGPNHAGRKAIEDERDESAFVAVEAAGDVPKRRPEQKPESEVRGAREPSPKKKRSGLESPRPHKQRSGGNQVPECRVVGVEAVVIANTWRRTGAQCGVRVTNGAG